MAESSLLRALHDGDNGDDDSYEPSNAVRTTRNARRGSQGQGMNTPYLQATSSKLSRSTRSGSKAPELFQYKRVVDREAENPTAFSSTRPVRPSVSSESIITSSANDKNIEDTMARMQHYIDNKDSFKGASAHIRRDIVKGFKSSFGNRYNGRCTELEKKEYISRWVKLADMHNELLNSVMEKESLGIKIKPEWLRQDREMIILD